MGANKENTYILTGSSDGRLRYYNLEENMKRGISVRKDSKVLTLRANENVNFSKDDQLQNTQGIILIKEDI